MARTVLGIIGGSGVYAIDGLASAREERIDSPWGEPSDAVRFGLLEGVDVVFLARHGRGHTLSPSDINYRANIDVLKRAGVTDAAGMAVFECLPGGLRAGVGTGEGSGVSFTLPAAGEHEVTFQARPEQKLEGHVVDAATGRPRTCIVSLINVNSPMTYDATMLGALKVYARANQACIVTPFILAGAMSPVTVAGTATQTLAEALAGLAFIQLLNPGCPMVLGSFASSLSMQSGAPTFGTPEPALVLYVMAALARRLGLPFRSGGSLCASKIPDAQAAFESAQTLLPTCLAGVNFVLHTAGWLEGGLAMGYEKFVMDADQAGMMHTLLAGVDLSENGQALSAIREVGPGKHFLGCSHTLANFETAFYRSPLADNNSYEQWEAEGRKDMTTRANARWKKMLEEYVAPPLDAAVDEALLDYMSRRKAAFPDSNV